IVGDMWETALAKQPISEKQRADLRLAMTHAAQSAGRATHMVGEAAGTTSIFTKSPLERFARDAEVVTRHNQLQYVNYEAVGRTVLGLDSNSPRCWAEGRGAMLLPREEIRQDKSFGLLTDAILERAQPRTT